MNKYQSLLDNCTGPVPKPYLKPRPLTGIEKEEAQKLEDIETEYEREFGTTREGN